MKKSKMREVKVNILPAQIIEFKVGTYVDGAGAGEGEGEGVGDGEPKYSSMYVSIPALQTSSETGGTFTYCSVFGAS